MKSLPLKRKAYTTLTSNKDPELMDDSISSNEASSRFWWQGGPMGKHPRRTWYRLLCLATLTLITLKWILIPIKVTGYSMFPTYRNGQINYANRLAYQWTPPRRGDIVVIETNGERVTILKRILGLPGERLRMRHGKVYINGTLLSEPYIQQSGGWRQKEISLGEDEYWAVGDNRAISEFGKVKRARLAGKILF